MLVFSSVLASATPAWNDWAVGRFAQCSTAPDSPSFVMMNNWEARLERQARNNRTVFGRTMNLYHADRCFVPRRVCKLHIRSPHSTLLLPREGPGLVPLEKGRFDVVLGAAQAFGVIARTSFASLLEQAEGGMPVVNLGKGAAGPHIYTDPANWRATEDLFAHARAVLICVMAGRSSPNSESGSFSSHNFGAEQLHAYDKVLKMWNEGGQSWRHANRLRRESLATAERDYAELARLIRASSAAAGRAPPRIVLIWFSACPIAGCQKIWQFPQYFLDRSAASGGTGAGGYEGYGKGRGGDHALSQMARTIGAEVVDASYGHISPSPPIPIDQCSSCPAKGTKLCSSPEARTDGIRSGKLCGVVCGRVVDPYYPDDAAHAYAAQMVLQTLRRPALETLEDSLAHTAPAPPTVLDQGSVLERRLEPISLSGKLFHSHVHKASGTTFLSYVAGLDGVVDCALDVPGGRLVKVDHTQIEGVSLKDKVSKLGKWWTDPAPRCTFVSVEEPELGVVYSQLVPKTAPVGARGATPTTTPTTTPQLITFVRHPFDRCRSHWK